MGKENGKKHLLFYGSLDKTGYNTLCGIRTDNKKLIVFSVKSVTCRNCLKREESHLESLKRNVRETVNNLRTAYRNLEESE